MTKTLKLERILSLPSERCFAMWQDVEVLRQWWGPRDDNGKDFKTEDVDWPMREGAPWRITMRSPAGNLHVMLGEMLELSEPNLLRFSFHWASDGTPGERTEITVRFEPDGSGTRMTFVHAGLLDDETLRSHKHGWNEFLDRFSEAAAGETP